MSTEGQESVCVTTERWPDPCQRAIQTCKSTLEKWERGAFASFSTLRQKYPIGHTAMPTRTTRVWSQPFHQRSFCNTKVHYLLVHMGRGPKRVSAMYQGASAILMSAGCCLHHGAAYSTWNPTVFARLNAVTQFPGQDQRYAAGPVVSYTSLLFQSRLISASSGDMPSSSSAPSKLARTGVTPMSSWLPCRWN